MKQTSLFQNFILILFIVVLFGNCNTQVAQQGNSTLVINVDTTCTLYVDNISFGILKKGDVKNVKVNKGEHLIIAKNIDSTLVLLKQTVEIKDSTTKVIDLKIASLNTNAADKDVEVTKGNAKETSGESKDKSTVIDKYGSFTDSRDGKTYKNIKIGTQTWMAGNLAYKASSGCWAYNDDVTNVAKYGYLYNWETAKTVCPTGWHLPTDAEWTTLTTYLGGESVAGDKLKEISTTHWLSPNTGATNESGFSALPGGYRNYGGTFGNVGYIGYWWSSTEYDAGSAWSRDMNYVYSNASRSIYSKAGAFSVRCVRDK